MPSRGILITSFEYKHFVGSLYHTYIHIIFTTTRKYCNFMSLPSILVWNFITLHTLTDRQGTSVEWPIAPKSLK